MFRARVNFYSTFTPARCGTGAIVATNVAACAFLYTPNQGATQQSGFLQAQLTLSDGTESVTLIHGVHVENSP